MNYLTINDLFLIQILHCILNGSLEMTSAMTSPCKRINVSSDNVLSKLDCMKRYRKVLIITKKNSDLNKIYSVN